MKKAFLLRLLCLALAMLLPFTALASAQQADSLQKKITISITPGEMLKQIPAVADLLDTLSIQLHSLTAKNTFGLSLLAGDSEVFSAAFRADEEGLFVQSKETHEKIAFFSWEDFEKTIEQAMEQSGADQATIQQFQQSFSMGLMSGLSVAQVPEGQTIDEKSKAQLHDPAFRQAIINATGGDDSYLKFVEGLAERMVYTKGEFTGEDHDPADTKAELVVTQADIIAVMDTTFMKNQLRSQLSISSSALTPEEIEKELEEALQQAKDEIAKMDVLMPVTVLYHGDEITSFSMPITMKEKEGENPGTISVLLDYRRLTTDGTVQHLAHMIGSYNDDSIGSATGMVNCYANGSYGLDLVVKSADKVEFSMKGIYEDKDGQVSGLLSALPIENNEILLQLQRAKTETGSENHLSVYMRTPGADQLTLTADDKPLITLNVTTANEAPDGRFDALAATTLDSAIQPLKLSPEELGTFVQELSSNVSQAMLNLLSKLPSSAMELFMTGSPAPAVDAPAVDAPEVKE